MSLEMTKPTYYVFSSVKIIHQSQQHWGGSDYRSTGIWTSKHQYCLSFFQYLTTENEKYFVGWEEEN